MRRLHVPVRVALVASVLVLILLAAVATTFGYLIEARNQRSAEARHLGAAGAYVEHGAAQAGTAQWQQGLSRKLISLGLTAQLTIIRPGGRRAVYASNGLAGASTRSASAWAQSPQRAAEPTKTYQFPLAQGPRSRAALEAAGILRLDLYAPPADRTRPAVVALASGLATLLAGAILLTWAASRWLVAPLRRLNVQVDAIAGGDPFEAPATSPIREVKNVATAIAGMAARLAQTAENDARLEIQRRLLVSSIAHDLRTPLFALRGYLDAIEAGLGDPRDRLDRARAKAYQIDRLVTGLFDYARADIDERPSLVTTDLAQAVIEAAAAFEQVAHERGVKLQVTAHARPSVLIDPDGFERAFANVVDNALRHTPSGGTVDVACGEEAGYVFVRVIDDGPGIAADLLPHLFELSGRVTNNRSTGGAGLGLTIAARLLRNQGCTIDAANAPPRGAVLTLELPLHGARAQAGGGAA